MSIAKDHAFIIYARAFDKCRRAGFENHVIVATEAFETVAMILNDREKSEDARHHYGEVKGYLDKFGREWHDKLMQLATYQL